MSRRGERERGTTAVVVALAARFATAGRAAWARTALVAIGVGLGVALLLLAVSVPTALGARESRAGDRSDFAIDDGRGALAGARVLHVADVDSSLGGYEVRGRLLSPESPGAPIPPGLTSLPQDGQMAVSPALRKLLASPEGELVRARVPYDDVATISEAGLLGPDELAFYAVDDRVRTLAQGRLIDHFGEPVVRQPLDPVLSLVLAIGVVALLLPVAVFVGTAARFGVERRDRRLAALRLVGLNARSTRRLAAAEALWAALLGDVVGLVGFFAGRELLRFFSVYGLSVFPADASPPIPLLLAVLVAVPVVAVAATLLGLRPVAVEPLGVVRSVRADRRRLWWRLLLPVVGTGLLVLQLGAFSSEGSRGDVRTVIAGLVLLLVGVLVLLPWLVEAVVGRLGGGPVPWQLAVRRLQAGGATSGRVVGGVAVAITGLIALQALFAGLETRYTLTTGEDLGRADLVVRSFASPDVARALGEVDELGTSPGVASARGLANTWVTLDQGDRDGAGYTLIVGRCASLAEVAKLRGCTDGDVFLIDARALSRLVGQPVVVGETHLGTADAKDQAVPATLRWRIPADAVKVQGRFDPTGFETGAAVLATPASIDVADFAPSSVTAYVRTESSSTATLAGVVRAVVKDDPTATIRELAATRVSNPFTRVRRGLYAGALAVLATIGASMLVSSSEQVRERKRVFAALAAVGVRRSTLSSALLLDSLVPVVLGLGLAIVAGTGLGALLLVIVNIPIQLDLAAAATAAGLAGLVVLAVSALGLTKLRGSMSPEGLRSE